MTKYCSAHKKDTKLTNTNVREQKINKKIEKQIMTEKRKVKTRKRKKNHELKKSKSII